jgi:hypothetical protein
MRGPIAAIQSATKNSNAEVFRREYGIPKACLRHRGTKAGRRIAEQVPPTGQESQRTAAALI